jgi:3-hydroxyisobutyrate dehydrogenase
MKIGTIGIGAMGAPMAQNLAQDGDTVLAFDMAPEKVDAITGDGVTRAESVADIAENCELIVIMTPDDKALRNVIHGDLGILSVKSFKGCVVDLSTTSEDLARETGAAVAAHGAGYLDGAVIGGSVAAARNATSPVIVSGDESLFNQHKPVLERLGSVDYAGAQGNAKIVKICNNLLLGIHAVSGAEALSIGEAAGLTLENMTRWLDDSSGNTVALQTLFGHFVQKGTFPEGIASLKFYDKDMALGCALAERNEFPAHFAHLTRQIFATAAQVEGGEAPFASILTYYRAMQRAVPEDDRRG